MLTKIYIETYGCSYNQASTEIMEGLLLTHNYSLVEFIEDCQLIIINTCIVKTNTEARILNRIEKFSKQFPAKRLLITGCMPEVLSEKILKIAPASNLLGPHYITNIVQVVQSIAQGSQVIQIGKRKEPKLCLPRNTQNPVVAKIQIAQGCLNQCTYCITKYAMGNLYSYSENDIINEIAQDLKKGAREIWLTAQDTGCYGFDSNSNLLLLLKKIIQLPSEFRVRIGMMNPNSFLKIEDSLLEIIPHPKIYNFLHVPLQSGNDEILRKMNRGYSSLELLNSLLKFRKMLPDLTLALDVIVGFPTETNTQFEDTIQFIQKVQPDIVNISKFGARPKTMAAHMKPVPTKIVKKRSTYLFQICNEIALHRNTKYIEQSNAQCVLTVSVGRKGGVFARTPNYKPVILPETCKLGQFYKITLTEAYHTYLKGILH
ncbi:MAG: tRNA (N(6)-L-threonylcarbamoyladenosine(37)-C(2))-methylthiotransferase [Candidatus Helarchaeota archaeon]